MLSSTSEKIDIAGLKIDPVTKQDFLNSVQSRVVAKEKTFVVTPYSEFLYASLRNPNFRDLLNSADFSLADGIGILWANLFLSKPLTLRYFYLNVLQAWWQVLWTGFSIVLQPKNLYRQIPEKIVGADLVWDLAHLAEKNSFSIYMLGARGDVARIAAKKLQDKFPRLKVVGTSNKEMSDPSILDDINAVNPDMLFVAFKAQSAEQWISENLPKINTTFAIALGGTFDYVAGTKKQPPKFIRRIGLEWLYRLFTQPSRIARIYQGVVGLVVALVRHKVFLSAPYRTNAAAVVVNSQRKVLVCKRVPGPVKNSGQLLAQFDDYWQFPQGGLDYPEDIFVGATRELQEETGIVSVKVLGKAKFVNRYSWNHAVRSIFTSKYKYRGQEQHTVFFLFEGSDEEIQLDQRELIEYKWVDHSEVVATVASERRHHAEAVLAELREIQL